MGKYLPSQCQTKEGGHEAKQQKPERNREKIFHFKHKLKKYFYVMESEINSALHGVRLARKPRVYPWRRNKQAEGGGAPVSSPARPGRGGGGTQSSSPADLALVVVSW